MKKSELHLTVTLDENRVPETIQWHSAGDLSKLPDDQAAHALNLTLWNKEEGGTLRVGLWTKDMPASQLKRFYIDTMAGLAADVLRATGDEAMANHITDLCDKLHQQLNAVQRQLDAANAPQANEADQPADAQQ